MHSKTRPNARRRLSAAAFTKLADWFAGGRLGDVYLVKVLGEMLAARGRSDFVEVDGRKMFLDPVDSLRLSIKGKFEPYQTQLAATLIKPGDVVVDIGAHIGYYTVLFSQLAEASGRVIAFEPDPQNFALLTKNCEVNACQNTLLEKTAVADGVGEARLYREKRCHSNHSLWRSRHCHSAVTVPTTSLDAYLAQHEELIPRIRLVKMDIEGAEPLALEGMRRLLKENNHLALLTEFLPFAITNLGLDPESYLRALQDLGFALDEIDEAAGELRPVSVETLVKRCPPRSRRWTNLLCRR